MKAVILDHYGKKDGYGLAKCQTLSYGKAEASGGRSFIASSSQADDYSSLAPCWGRNIVNMLRLIGGS